MDLSRKLFSSITGRPTTDSRRVTEDAAAFSEESLAALQLTISDPNISTSTMKENMLKLIYGDMMGLDVQFGTIYALKLAQSGQTVAEKRAGYLACSLLLQEGNELNIMLINTLQKDLTSSNYHHVVVALVTLCNMTLPDVLPSMISHVLGSLSHTHESVRKRALVALKNIYTRQADLVAPYLNQVKESLCDSEPSVMSAALGFLAVAVQDHASEMKDTVPVLIKILQQVVDGKLPKGYSYHGMAAPWIQIRCLMIMARLGQDDLSASKAMTPVVMAAFHKARQGVDAAFGVLFEIIRTLNSFHPAIILDLCRYKDVARNPLLIILRFATSSNQNLKYLGISMLCQVHPNAWSDAWWTEELLSAVVQALESRDATVQRRALDLLYRMLTLENSENIIERLVHAFYQEQDQRQDGATPSRKEKILGQILDAAERFGLSEQWYLDLVFDLLERGGDTITLQTAETIMGVLEKGAISPAFNTTHLRVLAVRKATQLLAQRDYSLATAVGSVGVPQHALSYLVLWVLGEYGDNAEDWTLTSIMETLSRCLLLNQGKKNKGFFHLPTAAMTLFSG
ncbi:AP-4 complex subunit epsilon-1 [Mortierella sp. GBA30]|nr:AP-4 complex subunit epsilon-1 [Mortierella sp. GBA30]